MRNHIELKVYNKNQEETFSQIYYNSLTSIGRRLLAQTFLSLRKGNENQKQTTWTTYLHEDKDLKEKLVSEKASIESFKKDHLSDSKVFLEGKWIKGTVEPSEKGACATFSTKFNDEDKEEPKKDLKVETAMIVITHGEKEEYAYNILSVGPLHIKKTDKIELTWKIYF